MDKFKTIIGDTIPYRISKYFSVNTNFYSSIISNYLWFSDPLEFNDPYDCNLTTSIDNTEAEIRDFFANASKIYPETYGLYTQDFYENRIEKIINSPDAFVDEIKEIQQKSIIPNYGICCFSEKEDDLLMWSHYTDKHKGVCVTFEIREDIQFFSLPLKVDYPPEYPYFNFIKNRKNKEKHSLKFYFATKSNHWEYESEIRIVKDREQHSKFRGPINFNKKCIKELIFGYRMPEKQKHELIDVFKCFGYEVVFSEMKLKQFAFGLEKIKIK